MGTVVFPIIFSTFNKYVYSFIYRYSSITKHNIFKKLQKAGK